MTESPGTSAGWHPATSSASPAVMTAAGPFRVLVADPPWQFRDALPGRGRGAAKHYRVLPAADICAFPLPSLADNCTLFLWRVAAMQQEALDVMAVWGFRLKSEIVWRKLTTNGKRFFGMGRTVRGEHEVCLIGTRGRPVPRSHSIRSTFSARVGRHSEKPGVFYDLIEALFQGPYVELFARRRRAGWTSLGDQVAEEEDHEADVSGRTHVAEPRRVGHESLHEIFR